MVVCTLVTGGNLRGLGKEFYDRACMGHTQHGAAFEWISALSRKERKHEVAAKTKSGEVCRVEKRAKRRRLGMASRDKGVLFSGLTKREKASSTLEGKKPAKGDCPRKRVFAKTN